MSTVYSIPAEGIILKAKAIIVISIIGGFYHLVKMLSKAEKVTKHPMTKKALIKA